MYRHHSPLPLHGKLYNETCNFQNAFWWASFRIAQLWLRGKLVWNSLICRLFPHPDKIKIVFFFTVSGEPGNEARFEMFGLV